MAWLAERLPIQPHSPLTRLVARCDEKTELLIGVVLQVDIDLDLILVLQRVELLLHQLQIPVRAAQFLLRLLLHVLLLVRFYCEKQTAALVS